MTTVKILTVCLAIMLFSGCAQKECLQKVYLKCRTPDVEKPVMDNTNYNNILDNAKKALMNYEKMKAYAEKLEEANRVCK